MVARHHMDGCWGPNLSPLQENQTTAELSLQSLNRSTGSLHVGPGNQTRVFRLDGKHLCPLSPVSLAVEVILNATQTGFLLILESFVNAQMCQPAFLWLMSFCRPAGPQAGLASSL